MNTAFLRRLTKPYKKRQPNETASTLRQPRLWLIVALLGVLAISRFLFLTADFPTGLTATGVLYTDEGWWSRNAIAWVRDGNWYIDDGYNPIIDLPVLSLLQTLWFKLFDPTLSAARALSATCTVIISALVFLIVRREVKTPLAWLSPLLVLSSYSVFAFGRLALLEMPMMMLILMGLWLITAPVSQRQNHQNNTLRVATSGLLFLGAALTKTTALFTLPIFLSLVWMQASGFKKKIFHLALWLLTIGVVYGLYYVTFVSSQSTDHSYFTSYNVTGKLAHENTLTFLKGPLRAIKRSVIVFPTLFPCLLISLFILIKNKAWIVSKLALIAILWSFLRWRLFQLAITPRPGTLLSS